MRRTQVRAVSIAAIAALVLPGPTTALADCTTDGGGGTWGAAMDVTPNSFTYPQLGEKEFSIKNTGSTPWTIANWSFSHASYWIHEDVNGCKNTELRPGWECKVWVTGAPSNPKATFKVWAVGGAPTDTSTLNP
jgi:hypothetical protein